MPWPRFQDRRILIVLIASLVLLAWWALWVGEKSPWGHYLVHTQHPTPMGVGPLAFAAIFVCGWTLMTIAMMLPTSTPLILLFHRMIAGRRGATGLVGLLIASYLMVWLLFGGIVLFLIRILSTATGRIVWLAEKPWALAAAILLIAGLYQFSSLKYACLDQCRSPMTYLVARWHGNRPVRDAIRLGAEHGIFCVGCCWSLMLLMFAVGTGSLGWMLALGAIMAAEKNLPWGRRLSAPTGIILVAAAAGTFMWNIGRYPG